jgi:putative ABC transport system permease protein
MIQDLLILAGKNLSHRGLRSWLTLLGIFIGVTAVVSLISLGDSLQLAVSSQFGVSQTEVISVQAGGIAMTGPPGSGVVDPLVVDDVDTIRKLGSVKRAVRRNILSGKLEYNDHIVFGYASTIPSGKDRDFIYEQVGEGVVAGRLIKETDSRKVLLGYNFYVDKAGLEKAILPGKKILLQDKEFEVVGFLEKKGSFIFDNAVFMNEDDAENLWRFGDEVDVIVVQPKDKDEMDETKADIEKALRRSRGVKEGEEDFNVQTPEASMAAIGGILDAVTAFIAMVAAISIFIGSLGIVNTMTTSVLERRKDIGIMKSVGATNFQVFMQFFLESSLLGLVGGFVGACVGTLIGVGGVVGINNWLGTEMGLNIDYMLIGFALLGSFLIGGIAGIVPAMNAARQHPVEALNS